MQKRKWLATEKIYGGSQLGREKGKKERERERKSERGVVGGKQQMSQTTGNTV